MASPPKPWERAGASAIISPSPAAFTSVAPAPMASSSSTAPPTVPERPAALANSLPTTSLAAPGAFGAYSSPYSTPYSRFGSGVSPYGGGYGMGGMSSMGGFGSSYGGGFGSYGGSYGGMGMNSMYPGYGNGFMPGGGNPYDPMGNPSLTQALESSTQHTFALLQSIVQTFSGVAQMLESTFMATHSSFFAMVGVVDQFAQLRNALGSVLGLFGLLRWARDLLLGPTQAAPALRHEFREFLNGRPVQGPSPRPAGPKPSKKPLIVFFLAAFGIPLAMHRLVRMITQRQAEQRGLAAGAPGLTPLDPAQLTFARAVYAFAPTAQGELALTENEIVAIMGKLDPRTGLEVDPRLIVDAADEGEWWKGRTRDGREGWFPRKWVQVIERKKEPVKGELAAPGENMPAGKVVA